MGILDWMAAGCLIGAAVGATILTGGAAAPAVAGAVKAGAVIVAAAEALATGAVVGAAAGAVVGVAEAAADAAADAAGAAVGAAVGAGAGAVVGVAEAAADAAGAAGVAVIKKLHRPVEHVRSCEEKKREEEEEKARRRREEEETVSRQPFVFFCLLHSNNKDEATRSHSGQNTEETQGTGTQTHHGSTSKQDKAEAARGGAPGGGDPPGGGGGRRDEEDGDSDQETSDSKTESDSEEESQQTGEPKKRKRKRQRREGATVLTANLRSLNNKELQVLSLVQENQVSVACLTETFLDQNIADRLLSRASGPNFNYQYRNRQVPEGQRRRRRSGGVAMMFSTDLLGEPRHFGSRTTFEYDARLVQHGDWIRPIVFICLYRRPGQTRREMEPFLRELEELLNQARLVNQSVIVTGDFNVWVDQNRLSSRLFRDFLNRNHLRQHVDQPTHNRGHTLDLVLTRNVQISDVSVCEELISDHYPVFFEARPDQSSEEEEEEMFQ